MPPLLTPTLHVPFRHVTPLVRPVSGLFAAHAGRKGVETRRNWGSLIIDTSYLCGEELRMGDGGIAAVSR